jgi:hypothetical protein
MSTTELGVQRNVLALKQDNVSISHDTNENYEEKKPNLKFIDINFSHVYHVLHNTEFFQIVRLHYSLTMQ